MLPPTSFKGTWREPSSFLQVWIPNYINLMNWMQYILPCSSNHDAINRIGSSATIAIAKLWCLSQFFNDRSLRKIDIHGSFLYLWHAVTQQLNHPTVYEQNCHTLRWPNNKQYIYYTCKTFPQSQIARTIIIFVTLLGNLLIYRNGLYENSTKGFQACVYNCPRWVWYCVQSFVEPERSCS